MIHPDDVVTDDDKEWDKTASAAQASVAYNASAQVRVKFPEVRGLCRTCRYALIRRREYSEMPQVLCDKLYESPHRVPPDIIECSGYTKEGQMDLRDMHQMGILIDARKKSGQYL